MQTYIKLDEFKSGYTFIFIADKKKINCFFIKKMRNEKKESHFLQELRKLFRILFSIFL